ncbi:molybdopterin-dependent oxidoreductase [Parasedimentitalea psychrophila]|uniref:Molybdopterin-dependent oxidoreductase n=1 Tax=Parasedimentitalea psychrophila TaxID=2997337 RepID=A0A9Y2L0D6_9RHOB|nr:molybdopterin-dependent oxidoreductase [Parasedimentitalea psychrophila]WIY25660.1 molybdopterin-dependent oxidoreductase [Parasedimentitalea psychrophila]
MVTCIFDGETIEVDPGTTILTAARQVGSEIPTFCYHARLSLSASCRMCLVEVEGRNKLEPACATVIAPDMVIHSQSARVVSTRQDMLEILLANHPLDCPVCDKGGECELQDTVFKYGKGDSRLFDPKRVFRETDIELNKVIVFNANRCIQCQRCVRVCEEIVGDVALGTAERGLDSEITGVGNSLKDCSHCGNCIEVCPVGALMSIPYRYQARPWDLAKTETICGMCGTGCSLSVEFAGGTFKRVKSAPDTGLNKELLCAKGRFGFDAIDGGRRIEQPMIRKNGVLEPASWDEAIACIACKAWEVKERQGRIQGHISPRQTNETGFVFQHLMRRVFETQDIHSSTRFSGLHAPDAVTALARLVTGHMQRRPLQELLEADCIFLLGANITEENPVSGYLIRSAMKGSGKRLIIASSRPCGLDLIATATLRLLPGNEGDLLSRLIAETPQVQGNPTDEFAHRAAGLLAGSKHIALLIGSEFMRSSKATACLSWIEQAARHFGAQGKKLGLQFLFDRPNQLGLWDMGCLAGVAPGWQNSQTPLPISDDPVDLHYVLGADPLHNNPHPAPDAKPPFLVVHSSHYSKSAEQADVLLPAPSYGEEGGTYTNNEGRAQSLRSVRPPKQDLLGARQVFNLISGAMGQGALPVDADQVRDRIAAEYPGFGQFDQGLGRTMAAMDYPWQEADTLLQVVENPPSDDGGTGQRRYLLSGDTLFQSGQLAARSSVLSSLDKGAYVEMNPGAGPEHAFEGLRVTLSAAGQSFTAPLKVNHSFDAKTVFVPERFLREHGQDFLSGVEYPWRVDVALSGSGDPSETE